MMVQYTCRDCGKDLEPPRTKWCSDKCRMRYKRRSKNGSAASNGTASAKKKTPKLVVDNDSQEAVEIVAEIEQNKQEEVELEVKLEEEERAGAAEASVLVDTSREYTNRKMVAADKYNSVVAKNRELSVHVDLLIEERDKLTIQLGSTQDRLIEAERDSAANSARLERIPRLEQQLDVERGSRRDAERQTAASDAKLEQMIRIEADLANERVAHADTKRKYLDASSALVSQEELGLDPSAVPYGLDMPVSAGENARPGIKIAPSYRQSQLSNFVILLLLGVIIILAALVIRFVITV